MIEIDGLRVRAGDFALGPVSLSVAAGEYFVLLGPSGAGKTVLLETVAGLRRPTAGRVLLGGKDAAGLPPEHRDVGFVYQDALLFPHLDVAGNIGFGLRPASAAGLVCGAVTRGGRGAHLPEVRRAAELLGVVGLLGRSPRTLSGGERQRVALARSLARRPRVLLLDEPLSALDQEAREELQSVLRDLHVRVEAPVVHVTHSLEEATALGDRCGLLAGGRLQQVGPPGELISAPRTAFVARFTGGRNLYAGMAEPAPGGSQVNIGRGVRLRTTSSAQGAVQVLVRPEDVELVEATASAAHEGGLEAVVGEVVGQGAFVRVTMDLPPSMVAVVPLSACERLSLMPGRHVGVRIAPSVVRILAAAAPEAAEADALGPLAAAPG